MKSALLRYVLLGCALLLLGGNPAATQNGDLVQTIKSQAEFQQFGRALDATRYGKILADGGPYTVFAFTDQAFARLPASFQSFLFSSKGNATLEKVIAYHVIPGRAMSDDMFGRVYEVPTLDGYTLTIEGQMDFIRVNGSTVLRPDIPAGNGVIHLVDYVIIPRGL